MSEWLTGRGINKGEEKKTEREEKTLDHSSASLSTSSPPLSLSKKKPTQTHETTKLTSWGPVNAPTAAAVTAVGLCAETR